MTYQIAYGVETETLLDPSELVLLTLPAEYADIDDTEELGWAIKDNWTDPAVVKWTELVPLRDVVDSFRLAMAGEQIEPAAVERIVLTVEDAIVNNL